MTRCNRRGMHCVGVSTRNSRETPARRWPFRASDQSLKKVLQMVQWTPATRAGQISTYTVRRKVSRVISLLLGGFRQVVDVTIRASAFVIGLWLAVSDPLPDQREVEVLFAPDAHQTEDDGADGRFSPKNPNAAGPGTQPIPATDRMSNRIPVSPSIENREKRTGMKTARRRSARRRWPRSS